MNNELKEKILVVDDEVEICESLANLLEPENFIIHSANNGRQALNKTKETKFDMVICDIKMPEMNGLECFRNAIYEGVSAPFVFLTGFADRDSMLQAIRLGATDFINKPFQIEEILDVTYRVLEINRRKQRIVNHVEVVSKELREFLEKEERIISMMRIKNSFRKNNAA